jgi:transposase
LTERASAVQHNIFGKSPLAAELADIFKVISDDNIVNKLQKTEGRGPKGFKVRQLFRVFIASYYLNFDSIAQTVREIQNNPALAYACDLEPGRIPSRPTLSRFFTKLSSNSDLLQDALGSLTNRLRENLPDFGQHVAIDSSTVRTHSNPDHKPRADLDASWTAKGYKTGSNQKQWAFGMKLHLAVDAVYELPISMYVTTAGSADSLNLTPLLVDARCKLPWFNPETVLADRGYDALHVYKSIVEDFGATPVIPIRALRKGATKRRAGSQLRTDVNRKSWEWKNLYAMRTSVERTFGRLKEHRRLERHCYRGLDKITAHCLLSVLTLQAKAMVQAEASEGLRDCLRKVA